MSYKVDERKMMDYLYGELSEAEKKAMDKYLEEHPEAREEFEQMRNTQGILGGIKDKEVEVPAFVLSDTPQVVISGQTGHSGFLKKTLSIAASILVLLLAGYLTEFNFSAGTNGMQIGFGDQNASDQLSQEEVSGLIEQALARNNEQINGMIKSSESELRQLVNQGSTVDTDQMDAYMEQLRVQSIETLTGLLEASELGQKKYTEDLIREFAIYLDVQRQNDMQAIQTRFDDMIDNAQINRQQTNRILSNLINTQTVDPSNQY